MSNATAGDTMVRRLETELREKESLIRGIFDRANAGNRDIDEHEQEMVAECRSRMSKIKDQLDEVHEVNRISYESRARATEVDNAISTWKGKPNAGEVEYRSAGAYMLDSYRSHLGDREASDRLEVFYRAAEHQKTTDNLGVVPDPVIGDVLNFIDAARPITSVLGVRPLPGATWHRPYVSQHTAVDPQGTAGAAADQKSELISQKMVISRLTANAVTYGGYVNVSRQNIDFSQPQILDIIVNDLATQYAIQTEAAVGAALNATATASVGYGASPTAASISGALWRAAADVYTAVKGQGRLVLAIAPDRLESFGPLFAPVNPQNAQSAGMTAGTFAQGQMGTISGVPVVMSAGLGAGDAFLFSTAAVEVYEQRIGTLQVTEPSVLGVQVAYAGYFTPLTILDDAIVPLTAS